MFRYFYLNNLPDIFSGYFMTNHDTHNYNTRNASLLHKKCTTNEGIAVWNNLPSQYKEIRYFSLFKAKKYFLHSDIGK